MVYASFEISAVNRVENDAPIVVNGYSLCVSILSSGASYLSLAAKYLALSRSIAPTVSTLTPNSFATSRCRRPRRLRLVARDTPFACLLAVGSGVRTFLWTG